MLEKFKLKNTVCCELLFVVPPVGMLLVGVAAVVLTQAHVVGVGVLLASMIGTLVYIVRSLSLISSADITLSCLRNWQKDRLWYRTSANGTTRKEAEEIISARLLKWGNHREPVGEALLMRHKKRRPFTGFYKVVDQGVLLYSVERLTDSVYQKIMAEANRAAKAIKEKGEDTASAVAVILLADRVERAVLNQVRKTPDYEDWIVLPCVFDAASQQYHLDGLYDYNLFGKPVKNDALDLLVKIVFGGDLPLEENNQMDYSNPIAQWQEKTMADLILDFKEENQKEKKLIEEAAQQLKDGQLLYHEENFYLKHADRLAVYTAFLDEEEPQKVYVMTDLNWSYPKPMPISKKDQEILKEMVRAHYSAQQIEVEFDDDE